MDGPNQRGGEEAVSEAEARLVKLERVAEAARLAQSVNVEDRAHYRDAHERLDDALRALDAETE